MKAIVNRLYEFDPDEPEVIVTLENGYKERFWVQGLSDKEYINRTKKLYLEQLKEAIK